MLAAQRDETELALTRQVLKRGASVGGQRRLAALMVLRRVELPGRSVELLRHHDPLAREVDPRTFASVLYALGEDPGVVMDEMGHTDPALALRVYRQAMRRGADEKAALIALIEGAQLAEIGRRADSVGTVEPKARAA